MLYWRRVLAVVRGCQAPKRISVEPRGARKRVRWGVPSGAAQAGFTVGAGYGLSSRRVKHSRVGLSSKKTESCPQGRKSAKGAKRGKRFSSASAKESLKMLVSVAVHLHRGLFTTSVEPKNCGRKETHAWVPQFHMGER